MIYHRVPYMVTAVQYTEENWNNGKICDFCKDTDMFSVKTSYYGRTLRLFSPDGISAVSIGDYIAIDKDGKYSVFARSEFEQNFKLEKGEN